MYQVRRHDPRAFVRHEISGHPLFYEFDQSSPTHVIKRPIARKR
jgi:hypothetical protein